jgi:hypothetical protein
MRALAFVVVVVVGGGLAGSSARAADLSGKWEVQAMGSDRDIAVQQKGQKLVAHRVMWPMFDGAKYKLEHLYRGTINGSQIKGDLLVKEEEQTEYEVLRPFLGTINAQGGITLDGLPLKRLDGTAGSPPPVADRPSGARPSEAPTLSQAGPPPAAQPSPSTVAQAAPPAKAHVAPPAENTVAKAPPPPPPPRTQAAAPAENTVAQAPTPPPATVAPAAAPEDDPGASLFASIMGSPGGDGLFKVSASIAIPNAAVDLMAEGDTLYDQKKPKLALEKYEAAARAEGKTGVALLHRMGRCKLALKQYAEAKKLLGKAMRLDPQNPELTRDYKRAKTA